MTWEIFVGLTVLFGFMVAVITPISKLNSSITKLNCSIDTLNKNMASNEKRITNHGKEIDVLKREVAELSTQQKALKEKVDYFHHS